MKKSMLVRCDGRKAQLEAIIPTFTKAGEFWCDYRSCDDCVYCFVEHLPYETDHAGLQGALEAAGITVILITEPQPSGIHEIIYPSSDEAEDLAADTAIRLMDRIINYGRQQQRAAE